MKKILVGIIFVSLGAFILLRPVYAVSTLVFEQSPNGSGTIFQSSENGSDYDSIIFDNFTLLDAADINEIQWVGGYLPDPLNTSGPVLDFKIEFYTTVANQPNLGAGPVKVYDFDTGIGNANETDIGNGLYSYSLGLGSPFHADAGTKYWIKIVAFQTGTELWGLAKASGGDSTRFNGIVNCPQCAQYRFITTGDVAFSLYSDLPPASVPEFTPLTAGIAFMFSAAGLILLKKKYLTV